MGIVDSSIYKDERIIIKRWLMKSLLLHSFSYRSDGMLRRARNVLEERHWEVFPAIEIERELHQNVTDEDFYDTVLGCQYESRQAWMVLSLLYYDFQLENTRYAADHLHPRASFDKERMDWQTYNSILNLQLIPESENMSKGIMPLAEWVDKKTAPYDRDGFLERHLIPSEVDLSLGNVDEFLKARKQLLTEKLKIVI